MATEHQGLVTRVTPELLVLCILNSRTLSGRCGMKANKSRGFVNDQLISHVEDGIVNDNLDETKLEKDSADFYERRKRIWIEFQKEDWWVAVAVYLILASVAFVVV